MLNAFQVHTHTPTHTRTCRHATCATPTHRERERGRYLPVFCESISYIWFGRLGFCFCSWHSHWHFCHALLQFLRRPEQDKCQQFLLMGSLPTSSKSFEFRFNLQQLFQYSVLNSILKIVQSVRVRVSRQRIYIPYIFIAILTYVTHSKRKHI